MQLYEVGFQVTFANCVERGRAIVCAKDQQSAKEMVSRVARMDRPIEVVSGSWKARPWARGARSRDVAAPGCCRYRGR